MSQYGRDNGNMAAAIFAVTFVVAGGILICSAVLFTFSGSHIQPYLVMGGIFFFLIMLLIRIIAGKVEIHSANRNVFWILGKQKDTGDKDYVPEIKKRKRKKHTPPSVDSIKDLKNSSNNWVPTGNPSSKKRK